MSYPSRNHSGWGIGSTTGKFRKKPLLIEKLLICGVALLMVPFLGLWLVLCIVTGRNE